MPREGSRGSRTPSPGGDDTRRSSPNVVDDPSNAQVEQDIGFFAGPTSPAAAAPISPATRQFYRPQRRLSNTSTNSDAAFIDHRSQQHALSTAPRQRSSVTNKTPSRPLHKSFGRGNSDGSGGRSPMDENVPRRGGKLVSISPSRSPDGSPPRRERELDNDDEAVIDHRPSLDRNPSSDRSHRRHSPSRSESLPPAFTPSLSRRPSDAERALEDVCFPHEHIREGEMQSDQDVRHLGHPSMPHGVRGGLPGLLPNFPFPFDFSALEDHAGGDRLSQSPPVRNEPLISFSPPKRDTLALPPRSQTMYEDGGEEEAAQSRQQPRRMRKLSESAGTGGRSGRYQRKLALFEFGSDAPMSAAAAASATPETQRRADVKTPLLGRTRSGRAVHADFGTHTGHYPGGPRRANSTTGAGAASTEKERPYRFSFYSNALPSTIHARSLAELPAEGQTFEELFTGRKPDWEEAISDAGITHGGQTPTATSTTGHMNGTSTPQKSAGMNKMGNMRSDEDAEDNTWWLDVLCPTDAEMKTFSKAFGIHPLTTEDIQMEETREKIELFRNYYLVCFRSFDQDPYSPTYLEPLNMYIIVFREGTLSFHYRATPHPQNVRRRIKQLKDYISVSSDWISYALIDDITDAFGPLIQNIEYEVDSIDELVLILKETEQSDMLRRIGTCRKKVMGLLRLMGNKADVVKGLAKRCNENWSVAPKSDIGLYLSDIQDHLLTMTANLNHYEKILSRSHSNYLAQISIEMTEANNAINDVLSRLTALGTVLVPLNLVTGLWGMNVKVPGQDIDSLYWFFGILACLVAFAVGGGFLTYRIMGR